MDEMELWQQQQKLAETYRQKWDEELLALAADFDDLTPPAQEALRAEMSNRGLGDPAAPRSVQQPIPAAPVREPHVDGPHGSPVSAQEVPEGEDEVEFTWKVPLCNCESSEQALCIVEVLRRAGIESWVEGGGSYSWDINGPRILVAADQDAQAQEIVSRPIAQEILDQVRAEMAEPEPFTVPQCPGCGAGEPLLVAVEPVNRWECEACAHAWDEGPPADSAAG